MNDHKKRLCYEVKQRKEEKQKNTTQQQLEELSVTFYGTTAPSCGQDLEPPPRAPGSQLHTGRGSELQPGFSPGAGTCCDSGPAPVAPVAPGVN